MQIQKIIQNNLHFLSIKQKWMTHSPVQSPPRCCRKEPRLKLVVQDTWWSTPNSHVMTSDHVVLVRFCWSHLHRCAAALLRQPVIGHFFTAFASYQKTLVAFSRFSPLVVEIIKRGNFCHSFSSSTCGCQLPCVGKCVAVSQGCEMPSYGRKGEGAKSPPKAL